MKNVLLIIIFIAVLAMLGYFGLPFLIEKEVAGLRSDVLSLRQKVQKMEEESRAPLPANADAGKIIGAVNAISHKVASLDESFNKNMSAANDMLKKQKTETEEALKKQAESIDSNKKEILGQLQKIRFADAIEDIRGRILKVKLDLISRNIGTAKNELGLIDETLRGMKASASDEDKKMIEDFQKILKKAMTEIDVDLPSATGRIDLLWHEMGKTLRKA
jgi:cell division septum initiation protein DivIVA